MKLAPGQVAVVTGAASGIGLGLANAFAARGMSVVLSDLRAEEVRAGADRVGRDHGVPTVAVTTDVRDPAAVEALAETTTDRFGQVDVVCNNAGVMGPTGPSWELDPAVFRWLIDVALLGVVHGVRAFVPRMIAAGHGHVLNTASMAGLMPLPGITPYGAAKHGVVGFTESLRAELALHAPNVGATALCPGYVPSDIGISSRQVNPADVPLAPLDEARASGVGLPQEGLTMDDVTSAALAGIEANRAHVIVYRGGTYEAGIRARVQGVLDDLRP
ncbi:SDR family NAD(P)-dependent oxidoreductase [Streptomyces sp. NPDC048282]|uniref:SDR family NAD(P)-dependent oxidoreductase n=1 Tax=Streptomyces sp. NPDC048282 TaxID=3365528 RepID=UPI003720E365